jgi:WhiB family redox-sensing transcriptional regulator
MRWMAQRACTEEDAELFFAPDDNEELRASSEDIRKATAICFSCPVIEQCYYWAYENKIEHGIWGGECGKVRRRKMGRLSADHRAD